MKKWGSVLLLAAMVMGLCGCHRGKDTTVQRNVVTEITITCQTDGELIQRRYTSQDKMRSVLLYIRSVSSPFSAPNVPQEGAGERVSITTVSADKTTKTYHQLGQRYFQEGDSGWKTIDPEKGANLWLLIKLLPSDPE